jgi:hypothetical protein
VPSECVGALRFAATTFRHRVSVHVRRDQCNDNGRCVVPRARKPRLRCETFARLFSVR